MYRLAVCEDEAPLLEQICAYCESALTHMAVEHEIVPFSSADELSKALDLGERFDLLCLDILMPGKTGMDLAQELRQRDEETSILFVSSSTEFLHEGYSVRPIQYLLKPVTPQDLEKVLADDLRLHHRPRTVTIRAGGKTSILSLADIQYIESRDHGCLFVLEKDEQFFWLSLAGAERLLPKEQFCRCHNSFLVNLAKITHMDNRSLTLASGKQLAVSRRFADSFQSQLTRHLNRQ